ncbi:MAG: hypothetical protein ACFFDT_29930 [Candidatus Hodarchaeota archaeon]
MSRDLSNANLIWTLVIILLFFILFFTRITLVVSRNFNDDGDDEDDDDDDNGIFSKASKAFGIITGPLLFLGGAYVLFMWTRSLQIQLFTEYTELDPKSIKKFQRGFRFWLQRAHMVANGAALLTACSHALGLVLRGNIMDGGLPHLLIWPALTLMLLYLLSGILLKFRLFSPTFRKRIRPFHKSPILIILLAGIILGHVVLISD